MSGGVPSAGGLARLVRRGLGSLRQTLRRRRALALLARRGVPGETHVDEVLCRGRCCFVLSTGRCGTESLTAIFQQSPDADAVHTPFPELEVASRFLYRADDGPALQAAALAARYELVETSHLLGQVYVETNNRITFLGAGLRDTFAAARFVHLVRHPAEFVRSGVRRGYYGPADHVHITPRDVPAQEWSEWSAVERVAWLWNETNRVIEELKASLAPERVLTVRSEDFFRDPGQSERILEHSGCRGVSRRKIAGILARPRNVQRAGGFPPFAEWTSEDRETLRRRADLAQRYGFELG